MVEGNSNKVNPFSFGANKPNSNDQQFEIQKLGGKAHVRCVQ